MNNKKKSVQKIQQIKSVSMISLFILVGYILIFSISVEIIGRRQDIKEIKQYFNLITDEVRYINKTKSEERFMAYLDDLTIRPYIKYVVCYENGIPKMLHTSEENTDLEILDTVNGFKTDIDMENVSLEGYIYLDDEYTASGTGKSFYLALSKNRQYSLLVDTIQKILFSGIAAMILVMLLIIRILQNKICKPLKEINQFVTDLVIGETPPDLKIENLDMQGIAKSLNEIRRQFINIKNTSGTVHEEVLVDILEIVEELAKKSNKPNEIYSNITEIMCKKVTKAVGCSLWLGKFEGDTNEPEVYRRAIYYFKDEFPIKALTPVSEALTKEVIQHGKIKIIRDFEADPKYNHFKDAYPLGLIAIPIRVQGKVIGSLCIWKLRIPYREVFSFRIQELANYVGKIIGSIMEGFDCIFVDKGNLSGKAVEENESFIYK